MHPALAWFPFLAAILVAFASGVFFAWLNQQVSGEEVQTRRGGFFARRGRYGSNVVFTTALVALLLAAMLAWVVAATVLIRFAR